MNSINRIRIQIHGGTDEEIQSLTDAITLVLVEHGIDISNMRQWGSEGNPDDLE